MSTRQLADLEDWSGLPSPSPLLPPELDPAEEPELSFFDGLATGFTAGPRAIRPSEWLPRFLGLAPPNVAAFDSESLAELTILVSSAMAEMAVLLEAPKKTIAPVFGTGPDGEQVAGDWADGFMQAVGYQRGEWEPLFADRKARSLIVPIVALSQPEKVLPVLEIAPEEQAAVLEEMADDIVPSVQGLYDFWRARNGPLLPLGARQGTKLGRNAPCPCGSGRKFKRCCGGS